MSLSTTHIKFFFGGAPPGASPLLYHSCEGQPRDSARQVNLTARSGFGPQAGAQRHAARRPPEARRRLVLRPHSGKIPPARDACAALKRRDLAIGARAGAQRTGAPRRGVGGVREGAWVGRAPAGPGNGRHVEVGGCRRLERRGVPLLCRRQPLFRAGAWRRAAASVACAGAAQRLSTRARPPARPPSGLAPPQARECSPAAASTSYLSSRVRQGGGKRGGAGRAAAAASSRALRAR